MMAGMDFDNDDGTNYMNFMNNMSNMNNMNNMSSSGGMSEFINMLFSQQNGLNETNAFISQNQRRGQIPSMHRPKSIKKVIEIELLQSFTGCVLPLEINRWIMENNMRLQETETLYVNIPKGIDNNELIVIKQKGNCVSEYLKGDVKVIVKIKEQELYIRKGLDLIMQKSITFKESICGFSFTISHIDGRAYKINSDAGFILANHNQKTIENLGMERDEHRGNLIIMFSIIFPDKFTAEQIEKLNEIL